MAGSLRSLLLFPTVICLLCLLDVALPQCEDFTVRPVDTVIPAGGNACLECDYPDIEGEQWFRAASSIGDDNCGCEVSEMNGQLCFTNFDGVDIGSYSCEVVVSTGVAASCAFSVALAVAPTINLPATSQLVGPVSSYLLIPVTFSPGMPNQTNVSWTRGGQTLSPDTDPRLTLHDNGSLAINDLQADDRGTYRVTVANTGGSDFHEFEVRVNFVTVECSDRMDGVVTTFTCTALGYPLSLSVEWRNLDSSERVTSGVSEDRAPGVGNFELRVTSTLTVTDPNDCASAYQVSVTGDNGLGASESIQGCGMDPVPLSVTVVGIEGNFSAVNVSWQLRPSVVHYHLRHRRSSDITAAYTDTDVDAPRNFAVITGLQTEVEYEFAGAAEVPGQSLRYGPAVRYTIAVCVATGLDQPIVNVMATLVSINGVRTISVSWNPSTESEATGYRLYIEPSSVGGGGAVRSVTTTGIDNNSYTLPAELCNDVTYLFTVSSMNSCGGGGPNSTQIEKACSIPENRIDITQIIPSGIGLTIRWNTDDAISAITLTAEELAPDQNNQRVKNNYTVSSSLHFFPQSACIQDLQVNTFYRVCVHITYSDGGLGQDCMDIKTLEVEMTDVVQNCIKASSTIKVGESLQGSLIPDWGIAVIVVGILAVVATVFCFMGLCFACHTSKRKDVDFGSMSSITREGVVPMNMHMQPNNHRPASPSRSCLSYHVKGHSTDWNKHADTLRQMDTDHGTNV